MSQQDDAGAPERCDRFAQPAGWQEAVLEWAVRYIDEDDVEFAGDAPVLESIVQHHAISRWGTRRVEERSHAGEPVRLGDH
jgi:hypothetical protein